MTDFNKGDFTQQGVDGHVNAKLRLNAKRYLDIDLTSNEQASGCTISGHVYDSLNDITYPIGSAPSGNIEITENTAEGTPLNIAQYATATVNVSGGGGTNIPMCELTIVGTGSSPYQAADPQRSVYIKDGVLQRSASFSTETLKVYSPYALTGEEYNVVYFCNRSYASESEALAAITNPVNVTPFAYEVSDAWYIVLTVIDPTQPSRATIPSDQK